MVGMSIARRIRSGTFEGPGICRKCRPLLKAAFFRDMGVLPKNEFIFKLA